MDLNNTGIKLLARLQASRIQRGNQLKEEVSQLLAPPACVEGSDRTSSGAIADIFDLAERTAADTGPNRRNQEDERKALCDTFEAAKLKRHAEKEALVKRLAHFDEEIKRQRAAAGTVRTQKHELFLHLKQALRKEAGKSAEKPLNPALKNLKRQEDQSNILSNQQNTLRSPAQVDWGPREDPLSTHQPASKSSVQGIKGSFEGSNAAKETHGVSAACSSCGTMEGTTCGVRNGTHHCTPRLSATRDADNSNGFMAQKRQQTMQQETSQASHRQTEEEGQLKGSEGASKMNSVCEEGEFVEEGEVTLNSVRERNFKRKAEEAGDEGLSDGEVGETQELHGDDGELPPHLHPV